MSLFVAREITSNQPPVQHCGSQTFSKGDLPAALDRASMAHARTHPPFARLMPARNAGTATTGICTPARSRSAPATLMMRIRGSGPAASIRARIRATIRMAPPPPLTRHAPTSKPHGRYFWQTEPRLTFRHGAIGATGPRANMKCGQLAKSCHRKSPAR